MNSKVMNFFMYSWFVSTMVCLILDHSWFGDGRNVNSVVNGLNILEAIKVGGFFGVPSATIDFSNALMRIAIWDYSFYQGPWEVMRYFWLSVLTPGLVWGVFQGFAYIFAQFIPRIGI